MAGPLLPLPSCTVKPESALVVPAANLKTVKAELPLILKRSAPGPTIAVLTATTGSEELSTIVPETFVRLISRRSAWPPALASKIACLSEPGPESLVLLMISTGQNERVATALVVEPAELETTTR